MTTNSKIRSDFEISMKEYAWMTFDRDPDDINLYADTEVHCAWLGWKTALSQQPAQESQPVAEGYLVNIGGSGEHLAVNWIAKPVEGLLYLAPPDYEALCAENEALKLKLAAMEPKP